MRHSSSAHSLRGQNNKLARAGISVESSSCPKELRRMDKEGVETLWAWQLFELAMELYQEPASLLFCNMNVPRIMKYIGFFKVQSNPL